jgi:hypothetical protein
MNRVGKLTATFLRAEKFSNFVLPIETDIPKRTCLKYGVKLKVSTRKNLGIKIVTIL